MRLVKGADAIVTLFPIAPATITFPLGPAATARVRLMAELVFAVDGETEKRRVATTPFAMAVLFIPEAMHVYAPLAPMQVTDLPAANATGPGLATTKPRSAAE